MTKRPEIGKKGQRHPKTGRFLPVIPEPQTSRSWRRSTRFHCKCGETHSTRDQYIDHWIEKHSTRQQKEQEQS